MQEIAMKYNCGIIAEDSTEFSNFYCDEVPYIPILENGKPKIKICFRHTIECQCSSLKNQILEQFPLAKVEIDFEKKLKQSTYIDIQLGNKLIVVEYNSNKGFGVSNVSDSYGEVQIKYFLMFLQHLMKLLNCFPYKVYMVGFTETPCYVL